MTEVTYRLDDLPMGTYDITYYMRGRRTADGDSNAQLPYVEYAASRLLPGEGMTARCMSQDAPLFLAGLVPIDSPDGRKFYIISREATHVALRDNDGKNYFVSWDDLYEAAKNDPWYRMLRMYANAPRCAE